MKNYFYFVSKNFQACGKVERKELIFEDKDKYPNEKQGKNINRHFVKWDLQVVEKHKTITTQQW